MPPIIESVSAQSLPPVSRRWIGKRASLDTVKHLADTFDLHPLVARVLVARHLSDPQAAQAFLFPDRSQLYDPALLHDAPKAVARIRQAIAQGERILVYGDYDVDGACATAILVRTLRMLGADPEWFVPDRFADGYGLHTAIVRQVAERGIRLIITVDTGITGVEAADEARACGVDLIVTDHHHLPERLPKATAIVHPAYPRALYPFADLCGAGVAFKLAQLLLGRFPDELLALAALATVADQVPLLRENRVLVHEGLHELNVHPSVGLAALAEVAGLSSTRIEATHAAFQLAPRLNALGRLGDAGRAVRLLLTDDPEEARRLADEANSQNRFRQQIQERLYQEALAQIAAHPEWLDRPALVVSVANAHEGVIGIVAGKLAERFYKPTLCVTTDGEAAKGSGRSVTDIHLCDLLAAVQRETGVFTRFGGHAAAAGFSLAATDIPRLRRAFVEQVEHAWPEDVPRTPYTEVDAPLALAELSANLVRDAQRLAPFGRENPEPVFFVREARVLDARTMGGDGKHLRARVQEGSGRSVALVAFGRGQEIDDWSVGRARPMLVTVSEHRWQDLVQIQLQLVDRR